MKYLRQIDRTSSPSPLAGEGWGEGQKDFPHRQYNKKFKNRAKILRHNQTEPEKRIWHILRAKQTGHKFKRQYSIDNRYIVDFICLDKRLVIEIDGETHCENKNDKIRTAYLEKQGFQVLRFGNNEVVENIEGCWEVIIDNLKAPLPNPLPQGERGVVANATTRRNED